MLRWLIHLIFPKLCFGCDNILESASMGLCVRCNHEVSLTHHLLNSYNEFYNKIEPFISIEGAYALFYFQKKGIVQKMIHALKYKGNQEVGIYIGKWFASELATHPFVNSIDCIVPVPLHRKKMNERGYNQLTAFGKVLSENLQIPFEQDFLLRNKYTISQTKKHFLQRFQNTQKVFSVNPNITQHYNHILIIDDIVTTGATLIACATVIKKNRNTRVSFLTMAYAQ